MKKVFIVTGEESGDLHAASLLDELYNIIPPSKLDIEAIGGNHLERAGAKLFFNCKYLSSVGLTEVLKKLPLYINLEKELLAKLQIFNPDVLILVDFPGFNLRLTKKAKNLLPNTKIVYYLPPQVWAWNQGRTKTLARYCDLVLCGLPFEEEFHRKRGVNAFYIGNPIVSELPQFESHKAKEELGITNGNSLIGLFPGSRKSEIHHMLPVLINAAEKLVKINSKCTFALSQAKTIDHLEKTACWKNMSPKLKERIKIIPTKSDENYKLLSASDIVWLTSGTVTLQSALFETPLILGYRGNIINYLLYLMVKKIDLIGLPNIIAGEKIVPELIQSYANADEYYQITKNWLQDTKQLESIKSKLKTVKGKLSEKNASQEAALKIKELIPDYIVV